MFYPRFVFFLQKSESGFEKFFLAFFLPIISGIIVALISSQIQKRNDRKRFEAERIHLHREQLYSAFFSFQKDVYEYISLFVHLQELVQIMVPNDPYASVDFSTEKGAVVRGKIKNLMNSVQFSKVAPQSNKFLFTYYCEEIESMAKKIFKLDGFTHIFYEFSKLGIEPARLLGGEDLEDYNLLVAFCEKNNNNGFCDITYEELLNTVIDATRRCEKRINEA